MTDAELYHNQQMDAFLEENLSLQQSEVPLDIKVEGGRYDFQEPPSSTTCEASMDGAQRQEQQLVEEVLILAKQSSERGE